MSMNDTCILAEYFLHLPYECYLDRDGELTRAQYDEIVSLAECRPRER